MRSISDNGLIFSSPSLNCTTYTSGSNCVVSELESWFISISISLLRSVDVDDVISSSSVDDGKRVPHVHGLKKENSLSAGGVLSNESVDEASLGATAAFDSISEY